MHAGNKAHYGAARSENVGQYLHMSFAYSSLPPSMSARDDGDAEFEDRASSPSSDVKGDDEVEEVEPVGDRPL